MYDSSCYTADTLVLTELTPRALTAPATYGLLPSIFSALADAVLLIDPHQHNGECLIVGCNDAACQMNGFSLNELLGRPISFLDATIGGFPATNLLEHLRTVQSEQREVTHRRKDHRMITIESMISLFRLDDREYLLRVDRDVSAHRHSAAELQRRVVIDRIANSIARRLNSPTVGLLDQLIDESLAQVGTFLSVQRMFIFLFQNDHQTLNNTHEWCAKPELTKKALCQSVPAAQLPMLIADIEAQRLVHLRSDTLPSAHPVGEQAFLALQNATTLLSVPLISQGRAVGFFGCHSNDSTRSWTNEDVRLLMLVGESISQTIERQQITMVLQTNDALYRMLTHHATDIISVHDADGLCRYCSSAVRAILGYEPYEIVGQRPTDFMHPEDKEQALMKGKIHDSGAITTTYRLRHKLGYYLWIETSARAVCDPITGTIREIVAVTRDVDARKTYESQIEYLAYNDALTGLANRRRLQEQIENTLNHLGRRPTKAALLYLDLDGFKKVNDTLGHDAGDELLVQVAARLRSQLRSGDTLARLGGDEFAILLVNLDHEHTAAAIAQRAVDQIRLPFHIRGQAIHLAGSIGIACSPQDGTRFEDILKHADIAMYRAKREGDRYQFFDPSLSAYSRDQLQLDADLREALTTEGLTLYYQPIQELRTTQLYAVEALVRWRHPKRGLLLPGTFVPMAEQSGLIRTLDRWVLFTALHQLAAWTAEGKHIIISINLSARSLHDNDLVDYISACLHETGARPERAMIEITETTAMRDAKQTRHILEQIRQLGMRVALDDFGSGHAALNYLKHLPIDIVKIDRSFIQHVVQDPRDEGVVQAIVALGRSMGIGIVAEGVTNQAQRELLQQIGCSYVQGFGIGIPTPAEALQLPIGP